MGSISRLGLSIVSELHAVSADVSTVYQEMANLIDNIHAGNVRYKVKTSVSGRMGHRFSMGLVTEQQSDPVAVIGTRLAEKGSPSNIHIPCRAEDHADGLEEEMDEQRRMFTKIQARQSVSVSLGDQNAGEDESNCGEPDRD